MMKRATLNFIFDIASFIALLLLALTGSILKFVLPPGSGGLGWRGGRFSSSDLPTDQVKYFFGLQRHEWINVHFYVVLIFLALIIVHIILHWRWIICMFGFASRSAECETVTASQNTPE
jgi:hypothetical protein